jgi:hypothetical protein
MAWGTKTFLVAPIEVEILFVFFFKNKKIETKSGTELDGLQYVSAPENRQCLKFKVEAYSQ